MGMTIRHVVLASAVLSVGSFIYMVGFAPMDTTNNPRAQALNRTPTKAGLISAIRRSMISGQMRSADRASELLYSKYPTDPYGVYYKALVLEMNGKDEQAEARWKDLDSGFASLDGWEGGYSQSQLDYLHGWSKFGAGDIEGARVYFQKIADALENRFQDDEGVITSSSVLYNLACYRAMQGEKAQAMEAFEGAIERGYRQDGGWWSVDPDLESLHDDAQFWELGLSIQNGSRERSIRTGNPG